MKDAGKTPKTIRNHHAAISAALHQGVRWGWVRSNVAELARPPRIAQQRVHAPSIDVVREVIEAAERRDARLAPLLMLAALTGMRRGELCALRWSDVDLEHGVVEVARSLVVIPGGVAEKTTKTDRSRTYRPRPCGCGVAAAAQGPRGEFDCGSARSARDGRLRVLAVRGGNNTLQAGQRHVVLHSGAQRGRGSDRSAP